MPFSKGRQAMIEGVKVSKFQFPIKIKESEDVAVSTTKSRK